MSETITFSETPSLSSSPGQVVARIGTCSLGTPGTIYQFVAGGENLVGDAIGFGPLAVTTRRGVRYGRQTAYAAPAEIDVAGAISAVTQVGGGPAITAEAIPATVDAIEGPWFGFPNIVGEVVRAGVLGTARIDLRLDGATPGDELVDPPPQLPARITGTVDITALDSVALAALNTKTFIVDPDSNGPFTTTFAGVDDYQDIIDQIGDSMKDPATLLGSADLTSYTPGDINGKTFVAIVEVAGVVVANVSVLFAGVASLANIATQIAAASGITSALETGDFISVTTDALGEDVVLTIGNGTANTDLGFTLDQADTGATYGTAELVGGRYLRVSGDTLGSTGTIDVTTGTANADLGFTNNSSAEGTDSTYDIPGLGVRLTFPAGTYEEGTTYTLSTTSPRMSIAGMRAAADALRADLDVRFAILHIAQEPADGVDLLAWQSELEDIRLEWAQAEDNPVFVKWVIGGPLGEEGEDNWAANDQDVKTTLTGTQAGNKFNTIAHGDIFLEFVEYSGRHRASIAGPYVEKMARYTLSRNPGFPGPDRSGVLDAAFLKSVSGVKARTEAAALVKMESSGFSVLRNDGGEPFIKAGRTRAPSTSQLTGEHTARAALECGRVLREVAFSFSNSTPPLGPDGQPRIGEKRAIEGAFNDALQERLVKTGYCSAARATIIAWVTTGGTDRAFVKAIFQRLANVEGVDVEIVVTDSLEIIEQSGG